MKNRFATLGDEDKEMLFARASEQTKLAAQVIEKDWWVTIVLQLLSQSSCADYLSFKGGTSLSKAWGLIDRFSEDADLALDHSFFGKYGLSALSDMTLYQSIVQHRREYHCLKYVDYDSNNPDRIMICPPDNLLPEWRADYEAMQQSFIYGKSLPFDGLIERIHILQERFRNQ